MTADPVREAGNVGRLLVRADLARSGDRPALITAGGRLSYRDLERLCNQAGNALREAGIRPGDRVLTACTDQVELVALLIGGLRIGAAVVPVSPWLAAAEYAYLIDDSECRAVFASGAAAAQVRAVGSRPGILLVAGDGAEPGQEDLRSFVAGGDPALEIAGTTGGEMALLQYTSGSTGRPKAVVHTHAQLVALAGYPIDRICLAADDTVLCVAKIFVAYGTGMLMLALFNGAAYCLLEGPPSPMVTATAIQQFRPTLYAGIPANYAGMLAVPLVEVGSLQNCLSAGDRLTRELAEAWRARTGLELVNLLASTESGAPILSSRPGSGDCNRLEVVPGFEARLVDESGGEAAPGASGELLVKGGSVFGGYWRNEALTRATFEGDWMRTGDRCVRNPDGSFEHLGRVNEMFKSGGSWVDPMAVESVINRHPAVLESAVVGRADRNGVVVPTAFLVMRPGAGSDPPADLRDHMAAHLPSHQVPRTISVVESLPRTGGGKIRRFLLGAT